MKYLSRILLALVLGALLWFCLFAVGVFRMRGKNYTLGNNISSIISKNLKRHESKKNVMKFLDARGLYEREIVAGSKAVNEDGSGEEIGTRVQGVDSVITVLIPEVESSLTSRYYVLAVFYFNKQQQMIDFKTQKRGIGL